MPVLRPDQGTGYTSIPDYLEANQGTLANEGAQIGSEVGGRIDAAHGAADQVIAADKANYSPDFTTLPGYQDALDKAIAAKDQAAALGSEGGVSDYFQRQLHDSRSQGDFDAQLLGASGKLDTAGLQDRASGLIDYLNQGLAAVPGPTATPITRPSDPERLPPGSYPGTHEGGPGTYPPPATPGPGEPHRRIPGGR